MNGARIFSCFEKKYRVTERHKVKISGNFANLEENNIMTVQMWPADSSVKIAYIDNAGHMHEFSGYAGQITKSLLNFDVEEV